MDGRVYLELREGPHLRVLAVEALLPFQRTGTPVKPPHDLF